MGYRSYVDIYTEWDIVAARQLGRDEARELGFGVVDQARITTAISELARNIYLYAKVGKIEIERISDHQKKGLLIIASDEGPGIDDVKKAMSDGYTTSKGLGAGMPGVKRLMDDFQLETAVGEGTTISIIKWLR